MTLALQLLDLVLERAVLSAKSRKMLHDGRNVTILNELHRVAMSAVDERVELWFRRIERLRLVNHNSCSVGSFVRAYWVWPRTGLWDYELSVNRELHLPAEIIFLVQ